jgi:hypothetical protein
MTDSNEDNDLNVIPATTPPDLLETNAHDEEWRCDCGQANSYSSQKCETCGNDT